MKTCTKCGVEKELTEFPKRKAAASGRRSACKICSSMARVEYYKAHQEVERENTRRYAKDNPEKIAESYARWLSKRPDGPAKCCLAWRKARPEQVTAYAVAYRKANPEKLNARNAHRRAVQLRATPAWADMRTIADTYKEALRISRESGIEHHVDHTVPLRSKLVCGLHTHQNLQIIPKAVNMLKNNRYWPDMPEPDKGIECH